MRYAGHEPAPGGSRTSRGSRSPWGHADGPGRMAPRQGPRRARQPHAGAAAGPSARIDPGREHLAVSARELVVEPRVRLLRRHRRPLLRRLEPPHRPALDHHVHRPPRLGQCMMISAGWYKMRPIETKLKELDDRCRAHLPRETISEHWERLNSKLEDHRLIRNAIAHFEPGLIRPPPEAGQGRARMGISPNLLDLTKVEDDGTVKALYVDGIFQAADEFLTTAQELTAFTEIHVPNWSERVSNLPEAARVFIRDIMKTA